MEKDIIGFKGYKITEDGRVISYKFKKLRVLKGFINRGGYAYVDLCINNKTYRKSVHQLVCQYFCDGYFEGAVVNHKDGNTLNNYYTNLEWVTQKENIKIGYKTSGIDQVRNYKYHIIVYPDGEQSEPFKGQIPIKNYIKEHSLNTSFSMLLRRGYSRGYQLITLH